MCYQLHKPEGAVSVIPWYVSAPTRGVSHVLAGRSVSGLQGKAPVHLKGARCRLRSMLSVEASLRRRVAARGLTVAALSLLWLAAGCTKGPGLLSEPEFRQVLGRGSLGVVVTGGVRLDRKGLTAIVRAMQDPRMDPVYRGYLWRIASQNLRHVSPDDARRLWFINHQEIAEAAVRRMAYSGSLTPSDQLWRSLQQRTGLRIAVDPHSEALYDGSMGGTSMDHPKASCVTVMTWALLLCIPYPTCVVGFGSVFLTSDPEASGERFSDAYERYRAHYERGAAIGGDSRR